MKLIAYAVWILLSNGLN